MTLSCIWLWELLNATRLLIWLQKLIRHNQTYSELHCLCIVSTMHTWTCSATLALNSWCLELNWLSLSCPKSLWYLRSSWNNYFVPNLLPLNATEKLALLLRQQSIRQTRGISSVMCTSCQCKEGCIGINTSP